MQRAPWATVCLAAIALARTLGACSPQLDARASRVSAPRVIAVRADPPEASAGAAVMLHAVVATPFGAVDDAPIDWQLCLAPRGPDESTTIAALCLAGGALNDGSPALRPLGETGHVSASAVVPPDACSRVGPQVPRVSGDAGRQRPPDPDLTGGYQLPIRLGLGDDVSFARLRLRCDLPDVGVDVAREFQARYRANRNPVLASVAHGELALPRLGTAAPPVFETRTIELVASVGPDAAETYVLVDPLTRQIAERTEALEVAWFANGGSLAQDRAAPDASGRTTNTLRIDADRAEPVTLWVVLRDERGGVDAGVFVLQAR